MKKLWKETAKKSTVKQAGKYLAATALLSCVMCGTAFAGSWYQGGRGWLYAHDDGRTGQSEWVQDGGRYYRIDDAGLMATGWFQDQADGGRWYYLNPNQGGPQGAMATGWVMVDGKWYFLRSHGSMAVNYWEKDEASGKCYYLGSDGVMLTDTMTPDGYYVGSDGAWVE